MKFLLLSAAVTAAVFLGSCSMDDSVPGCQATGATFCQNYTGADWLAYPRTIQDLYDECSGTLYKTGCPENTAYAVCRKDDYDEDYNYEYVFYTTSLSAGFTSFSQDECTILNNN